MLLPPKGQVIVVVQAVLAKERGGYGGDRDRGGDLHRKAAVKAEGGKSPDAKMASGGARGSLGR